MTRYSLFNKQRYEKRSAPLFLPLVNAILSFNLSVTLKVGNIVHCAFALLS
jgi:hypothetical protein